MCGLFWPSAPLRPRFHILALSQKRTRILECTQHGCREIPFPAGFPGSLADSKQTDQPDHDLDNRSSAGPDVGGMKRVMFGTTTDHEKEGSIFAALFLFREQSGTCRLERSHRSVGGGCRRERTGALPPRQQLSESARAGRPRLPRMAWKAAKFTGVRWNCSRAGLHPLRWKLWAISIRRWARDMHQRISRKSLPRRSTGAFRICSFRKNAKYEGTFDFMRQRVKHSVIPTI